MALAQQFIKQNIILYIGLILGIVNSLLIFPYTLKPAELGLFRFIIDGSTFLFPLVCIGIHVLPVRFYPEFKNPLNGHNGFLAILLLSFIVVYLFFLALFFCLYEPLDALFLKKSYLFQPFWWFIIPLTGLIALNKLLHQYTFNFKKLVFPTIFNELYVKIALPIITIFYYLDVFTLQDCLFALLGTFLIIDLSFIIFLKKINEWKIKINFGFLTKARIKELGTFASYGLLGNLGRNLATQLDIFMVSILATGELAAVGVYYIALVISGIISLPLRALYPITAPILAEAFKEKKLLKVEEIYKKVALNLLITGCFLFSLIWLSIDDIFEIMPKGELYKGGKYVVLILGIAKIFDMITGMNDHIIAYSKFFRFNFYAVLFLGVINVVNNYFFIPIYQIEGAALATLFSLFLYNIIKLLFIRSKMNMQPFTVAMLKVLILGAFVYWILTLIPFVYPPILNILFKSIIYTILFGTTLIYFNISSEINNFYFRMYALVKTKFF